MSHSRKTYRGKIYILTLTVTYLCSNVNDLSTNARITTHSCIKHHKIRLCNVNYASIIALTHSLERKQFCDKDTVTFTWYRWVQSLRHVFCSRQKTTAYPWIMKCSKVLTVTSESVRIRFVWLRLFISRNACLEHENKY